MHPLLRPRLLTAAAAGLLAACGSATVPGPGTASPSGAPATLTPLASESAAAGSPSPTPTPAPAAIATCAGADLNLVLGAENSASGGQQGMTILLANSSTATCRLSGTLQVQLLDSSGNPLPTTQTSAPAGQALLVPQRVALDPVWPQPGEATVLISWHTGDVQPGQCSGAAPQVGGVSITVPGGGSVVGGVAGSQSMAPCKGVVDLGPVTQVASVQTFSSDQAATQGAVEADSMLSVSSSCTPAPGQSCLVSSGAVITGSGGSAAYQSFSRYGTGGGAICTAYVYQASAGWHPLDVACTQNSGFNPLAGSSIAIFGPGSGCADAYASPSHAATVASCLPWSSTGTGTYTIDQGPVYAAETDPASQLADGTIWWHLQATGWITQDFLVENPQA